LYQNLNYEQILIFYLRLELKIHLTHFNTFGAEWDLSK